MKYLYIGLGTLIVLLAASILSCVLIASALDVPERSLEQAQLSVDTDLQDAVRYAEEAADAWEQRRHFLSSFLSHDELDEVDRAFVELRTYGRTRTQEEFEARCAELRLRLRHISEMDIPFYYNFL